MAVSKVISIEITDLNTKVCEISYNKKVPSVYNSICFANPEQTVEDALIEDRLRYSSELKAQLKNAGIKCKDVVFVISSNKILSREIMIPDMKEKLIESYIEGERATYFPMDISDHRLSYTVIDRNSVTKEMRIILYAAPDMVIKNYNALAAELDFHVVAMDCTGNAMYQYLSNNQASGMDMYLQINENNSLFTILENGKFALQRNMSFGACSLAEHLVDEEYYGIITPEQAMMKLAENELLYGSYSEMMEYMPATEEESKLYECKKRLTDAVRPLIAGFTRVLEYYNSKNKEATITKIYVGGCGSKIAGLAKLIMSEFEGIELEVVNVLPNVKFPKSNKLMADNSTEFMACIGGAGFSIDFSKNNAAEEKKGATAFAILAAALTILAVIVLVGVPLYNYRQAISRQEELRKSISGYQNIVDIKAQMENKESKLDDLEAFDEATITNNENWNSILEQLEIMLPTNTLVSSVSSNETGVTLVISIPTKIEAAKLLVQLRNLPIFEDVQINTLTENNDESTGIKNESFTITCVFPQKEVPIPEGGTVPADGTTQEDIDAGTGITE